MRCLTPLFVAMALLGCSAIPLNPGAEKVRLTYNEPKGCKFLGDVTGSQGNEFTGELTSNATMETGARNDLKNKAFALGGNVVYVLTHRAGQTGDYTMYGGSSYQSNVTITGNVYSCPE